MSISFYSAYMLLLYFMRLFYICQFFFWYLNRKYFHFPFLSLDIISVRGQINIRFGFFIKSLTGKFSWNNIFSTWNTNQAGVWRGQSWPFFHPRLIWENHVSARSLQSAVRPSRPRKCMSTRLYENMIRRKWLFSKQVPRMGSRILSAERIGHDDFDRSKQRSDW